jgi:nicotinate-nucleotide adenylyltransferase
MASGPPTRCVRPGSPSREDLGAEGGLEHRDWEHCFPRDMTGERLGIFGGTFDPPHVGHLVTAVNVRHELSLDRVLMVVANQPWQKVGLRDISQADDRLAMVEAAVSGIAGLEASGMEIERGGMSYTADTLVALSGIEPRPQLFVILGSDAAAGLATWERVDKVRELATVVVVERPGVSDGMRETAPADGWSWVTVEVPRLEVSSTDLRARVQDGRPLDFLLTPAVIECIYQRGLYLSPPDHGRGGAP